MQERVLLRTVARFIITNFADEVLGDERADDAGDGRLWDMEHCAQSKLWKQESWARRCEFAGDRNDLEAWVRRVDKVESVPRFGERIRAAEWLVASGDVVGQLNHFVGTFGRMAASAVSASSLVAIRSASAP